LVDLKAGKPREAYAALASAANLLPDRTDVKVTLADLLLVSYAADKSRPAAFYTHLKKLADELTAQDPNSYDGLRIKGYLAWSDEQVKEAEAYFRKANSVRPMMPDLVVSWVQVLFRAGQPDEAERVALQLIQTHKDADLIYDALYGHYRAVNQLAQAEDILRSKASNNPGNIDYAVQLAAFYAGAGKRDQMTAVLQRVLDDPKTFPAAHLKVGDVYASMYDWPEAMRQYQEGAKVDGGNKVIYLKRIADALLSQGKGEEAASVVAEVLKQQPDDEAAKAVNASLLLKSDKLDKRQAGVNSFQDLVKKQPENAAYRFALGRALLGKGDADGARAQFQELVKKRPTHLPSLLALAELSLAKRDYSQALQYANAALSVNPRLRPAKLQRAVALSGQRHYSEARAELTSLASAAPENMEVQFQLAAIDLAEKKFPQAEARLQQLYEKSKFMAVAGLVEAYLAQGKTDKAVSRLNLELAKSPDAIWIPSMLGEVYMRQAKYDLALEQCRRLQALGDKSALLQMRFGRAYQLKGDVVKALASFEAAKEIAPRDAAVLNALADAQQVAGRKQEAISNYRQILVVDPNNADAMNNLAYTLLDTEGASEEARTLVERALQKSPQNPTYSDTLGMVYLKRNLGDSAVQVFSGLVQRFPDNPAYRYHYAVSLSQKGQRAKAKSELEISLRKAPPDDLRKSIQSSLAAIQQ
jgi:predicted Zn-dependent protease